MYLGELAVRVSELQLDRGLRLGPAASDFGQRVFEAVHHVDAHAVLRASHRIEDRLAAAFGHPGHDQARSSRGNVELKLDRREDRFMHLLQSGCALLGSAAVAWPPAA